MVEEDRNTCGILVPHLWSYLPPGQRKGLNAGGGLSTSSDRWILSHFNPNTVPQVSYHTLYRASPGTKTLPFQNQSHGVIVGGEYFEVGAVVRAVSPFALCGNEEECGQHREQHKDGCGKGTLCSGHGMPVRPGSPSGSKYTQAQYFAAKEVAALADTKSRNESLRH